MKKLLLLPVILVLFYACRGTRAVADGAHNSYPDDTLITQSLFDDKSSTISEENIQRLLDGNYRLPRQLRIAMVKLESTPQVTRYWSFRGDEDFLKNQQSYLDSFSVKLRQSPRVTSLSVIPDLLISKSPSFTALREAGVRMQADVLVIYAITNDIYSRYKVFTKSDIKAFATTQLIVLDIRTGLIPFSTMVTKDVLSQKKKEELDEAEATRRIKNEAVLLTINEVGEEITEFLNKN